LTLKDSRGLEVYNLYEEIGGLKLGLIHAPLTKLGFSFNIDNIRQIIKYAGKMGIKTLVLPPFMPYGVNSDAGRETLKSISINRRNPYVRILKHLARLNTSYIISPYIVEKSRSFYHVSNLLIDGEAGVSKFFSRKILLSQQEVQANIKPGASIDVISDLYLKYSILLDEDVLALELSRLMSYIGVDVLLITIRQLPPYLELLSVAKALQVFTGLTVIHTGYIIEEGSNIVDANPTIIVLPDGKIHVFNQNNPVLVTIPLKILKESKRTTDLDKTRRVLSITLQYLRKIRRYKDFRTII